MRSSDVVRVNGATPQEQTDGREFRERYGLASLSSHDYLTLKAKSTGSDPRSRIAGHLIELGPTDGCDDLSDLAGRPAIAPPCDSGCALFLALRNI